jgi:hypothetical protein
MMRRVCVMLVLLLISTQLLAGDGLGKTTIIYGKADRDVPGWAIVTGAPQGWTVDCCTYASAIGVNAVIYQGEWTGKPERVMVLNVWPSKLPDLATELQDDRKHYLQTDPAGKVATITLHHPAMACEATLYEGSDHIDDVVVFCDPGKPTGIRLSWSMTFAANDPSMQALLDEFMRVVVASRYMKYVEPPKATAPAHGG